VSRWDSLEQPWQAAFGEAARAYLKLGSPPIGAVVVDSSGEIVARAANDFPRNRLAHAEVAALAQIPVATDRLKCEIFSTLEPCAMCVGAIRMCQLHAVHFAAADPSAGSSSLFHANEFMREFPCSVHGPHDPELELAIVALVVESRVRNGHYRWREHWSRYHPRGTAVGTHLAAAGAYREWVSHSLSPRELYERVVSSPWAA
jgi:tRNA(Arg) A34 adenosine deaminase TadA